MDLSLVLPTRATSFGTDKALQSAMVFRERIREIIVSVNTPNANEFAGVVRAYPDVRVVSPGNNLCHAAHWEFAMSEAKGEWVALLTDRGVLRADWLETLASLTTEPGIVTFRTMALIEKSPSRYDVQLPWFSGQLSRDSAAAWRERGRRMEFAEHGPYLLNALVHRSVLDQIIKCTGRLCGDLVGDCGFHAQILAAGIDWRHLEQPLVVMHSAASGIGASLVTGTRTPALEAFLGELHAAGGFRHAPLPEIVTNMNVRANEFAFAMPSETIDAQAYATALASELAEQRETFPADARDHLAAFVRARKLDAPHKQRRRSARRLLRSAFERCLGSGTSPLHRRLNLPVRSFTSLGLALDWASAAPIAPNRTQATGGAWH